MKRNPQSARGIEKMEDGERGSREAMERGEGSRGALAPALSQGERGRRRLVI